nr:SDR family NAD(P)-dependent oxidoreductase [Gordonia sp. LAM0048]
MTPDTAPPTSSDTTRQRVIVMTGGTSGIGAAALAHFAGEPGTRVLLGARGTGREVPPGVETVALDLTSLDSVRQFSDEVAHRLDGAGIDVLILNAGTQSRNLDARTADGYELAFGVNHLAHYLIVRLLLPLVAANARIIITTSDTHDPAITPLAPKSVDLQALARPTKDGFGAGMRAYAASKLCNLLTARALKASPEITGKNISVVAFNPGFTGGTNLGDASPRARAIMRFVVAPIFGVVSRFKPEYSMGRPERAGEVLAQLVDGNLTPPDGRLYVSIVAGDVTYPEPAELALDDRLRDDLWAESARMVGLVDSNS